MKTPETIKIKGEEFPLHPQSAIKKMNLAPVTHRLGIVASPDNEAFLAQLVREFRQAGIPFAFVDGTTKKQTYLHVFFCREKIPPVPMANHAIPREKSYKVRSAAKTSKEKAA